MRGRSFPRDFPRELPQWDVARPVLVVGDHMCLGGPDKVEIIRTLD